MIRPIQFVLLGVVTSILFLNACTGSLPSASIKGPSTYRQDMDLVTGGFQRDYRVHIPSGYDGSIQLPLVVVIHGAFDTAKGMERFSGFSDLADREQFIVLYPEGIGILGFLQHWNAGHCCGKAAEDQIDDVTYLKKAIDDVCMRLAVDRRRVYMTGFSNGGMMTYRFAAEHSDMLAAVAPIAASIGGRPTADAPQWCIPAPQKPLPILIVHGMDDDDIPLEGGRSRARKGERTFISVHDSAQFWIEANGCKGSPALSGLYHGAVEVQRWDHCMNACATVLCKVKKWGHRWPGPYFTAQLSDDDPLLDFDIAEMIWSFFKQFP